VAALGGWIGNQLSNHHDDENVFAGFILGSLLGFALAGLAVGFGNSRWRLLQSEVPTFYVATAPPLTFCCLCSINHAIALGLLIGAWSWISLGSLSLGTVQVNLYVVDHPASGAELVVLAIGLLGVVCTSFQGPAAFRD
jgi:hypothetical protein